MGHIQFNDAATHKPLDTKPSREPMEFHKRLNKYEPTPLHRLPEIASRLGVGEVLLKDESNRLGLPAFKILGASWAVYRTVLRLLGCEQLEWSTFRELLAYIEPLKPLELITATDGNHGRAVARMAALMGFHARIFVPAGTTPARIAALESEGASVVTVDGTYDEAVTWASESQCEWSLLIQDTSWPGYEEVPSWVIEGYSTMFWEIDDALASAGEPGPDVVVVQIGVGSLAAATVLHYRRVGIEPMPRIIAVEPLGACCALTAARSGRIVTVPGPHDSIMAGLNCGTLASVAWPLIRDGVDCFIAIDDDRACQAMRLLATSGVISGESGAAGVGAALEVLESPDAVSLRERLGISDFARILMISTEGATDPASYEQIVGQEPGAG